MSNLLAMPLVKLVVETGTNEDWIDSIKFVIDDGGPVESMPQLDIRDIIFEMEVRREAGDHAVVLAASTITGTLNVGDPPDYGFLRLNIPLVDMSAQLAGDYVADITGRDGEYTRVIAQIDLGIVEGITKQPVNKRIVVAAA
jgi:hypothetical protein